MKAASGSGPDLPSRQLDEAPFVNPFDPEVQADPHPVFEALRAESSVVRTPLGVSVVRREPVQRLLSDRRLVSAIPALLAMQGVTEGPVFELVLSSVLAKDGDDHVRLRRLVHRSFTPRAAARHRPAMRALANELVDGIEPAGRSEFMEDFAEHYPIQVICEVLGVPREDHERFARWGASLTYILSFELAAHLGEVEEAAAEMLSYIDVLVEDRRQRPGEDLVTSLVHASEGEDRLSGLELRAMIAGLLFAGYDTTRNQLGHAMVLFAQHPEQWELLAQHPELAPAAVNEVMRLQGAAPGVPRIAIEEVVADGWVIPAGTFVLLSFASANRDEAWFEHPGAFDITATRETHTTFGAGPHYCLGANLARAEMEEALQVLTSRLTALRLDGEPEWRVGTGIVGPATLPLEFRSRH